MAQLKHSDLMLMIEEYSDFKAELAVAKALLEAKQAELSYVREQIERYENIAIYAGVVHDLFAKVQQVDAEVKQYQEIVRELENRTKGFEDRKKDTVAEIYEDNGMKME
jgi:multidrug resistance efflux pump